MSVAAPAAHQAHDAPRPASSPRPAVGYDLPCAACGYNLRGLGEADRCPECGRSVIESTQPPPETDYPPAQVRWARLILLGLTLLLGGTFGAIGVVLYMPFSEQFGGTVPRINYIGPKIAAVSLMQRGLGYAPGEWGNNGVAAGLLACVGLVLLTMPPTERDWHDPIVASRFWARWAPLFLFGGFLGLTLGCEGVHQDDPQVKKFVIAAVAGVELPSTLLLYWHLRDLARRLALPTAARTFACSAGAIGLLMIAAVVMLALGRTLAYERNHFGMQVGVSVYMAVSVCAAAAALGAVAQVSMTLLPIALHRRPARSPAA